MRITILLIAFVLCVGTNVVYGQHDTAKDGVGIRASFLNYQFPITDDFTTEDFTGGIEFEYVRHLNNALNLAFPLRLAKANFPLDEAGTFEEGAILGLDATLQLKYCKEQNFLYPYLYTGVGVAAEDFEEIGFSAPVGIGLNFQFAKHTYLSAKGEYRIGFDDLRDNLGIGVGLLILLGPGEEEPPVITDRDGDGINDKEDLCPDIAGVAGLNGCPDTDGDGVTDSDDACPEVVGLPAFNGCPDTDGDGLADNQDDCPNEAGLAENNGCPAADADGDGVADEEDECPDVAGPIYLKGCPDSDSDGIIDKNDDCPKVAGLVATNGCPDTDNDGIADKDDRCPKVAGLAQNNGCPEIKQEDKETLEFATQAIQFETASSRLRTESFAILDKVVDILKRYPDYKLRISGHTDSIGSAEANLNLSKKRAQSCYDYMVAKGISPDRMSHEGYGETQPIADNRYNSGREQNRRVEFDVYLE